MLIYRALTWALPILVGIGCYVWWRHQAWTTPTQRAQPPGRTTVAARTIIGQDVDVSA